MTSLTNELDEAVVGYLTAALRESDGPHGESLLPYYGDGDFDERSQQETRSTLTAFALAHRAQLREVNGVTLGEEFWRARNGKDAIPDGLFAVQAELREDASALGPDLAYVGDDGQKLYLAP